MHRDQQRNPLRLASPRPTPGPVCVPTEPKRSAEVVAGSGWWLGVPHEMEEPTGRRAPTKRTAVTFAPLQSRVVHDMEACVRRFEADDIHSFAAFKAVWRAMQFSDIYATAKRCGRVPGYGEPSAQYIRLLLVCAGRHLLISRYPAFNHRLGGLFLVYVLHAMQPCKPPVPVPMSQQDWADVLKLEEELKGAGHGDGLKALRGLRSGGHIEHTVEHSLNAGNIAAELDHDRAAAALPARVSVAELGLCPYAKRLRTMTVQSLAGLETDYAEARAAAGLRESVPPLLSHRLEAELDAYESGEMTRQADVVASDPIQAQYQRRQAVRERPLAQRGTAAAGRAGARGRGPQSGTAARGRGRSKGRGRGGARGAS